MSTFKLQRVSKSFQKGKESFYALKNISLVFPNKGLITIAGKSGSGKSTLLNILMGIENVSEGNLLYDNVKINKQKEKKSSLFHLYKISMIYQHYNLFEDLKVIDNVVFPLLMQGLSKKEAIKKANDLLYEVGVEELSTHKANTLSGGEKQRVAIARALISNPLVLLCDEPTGALDSKNGEEIMKILKRLSKKILVVMVSHNQDHINKYSDRIITLDDGEVLNDSKPLKYNSEYNERKEKKKYSSKWKSLFFVSHFKSNLKKNIFSFFVLLFGFLISLTSIGFVCGSKPSFDNLLYSSLSSTYSKISSESIYHLDNSPLSLVKVIRPELSDIDEVVGSLNSLRIMNNYDYLFPTLPETTFNKMIIDSPSMVPIYSFKENEILKDLLITGFIPSADSIEEVIVNEEFVKALSENNTSILSKEIIVSSSNEVSILTGDNSVPLIKDNFTYSLPLIIRGVIKEFSFLNSPKIYYSSLGLEKYLAMKSMPNYSSYVRRNVSFKSYFDELDNDNEVTSYCYNIFVNKKEDIKSLYDLFNFLNENGENVKLNSTYFETYKSYRDLLSSFIIALTIFVIVSFLGLNFILGMIALSSFIEKKKESAIMTCLGAKSKDIISLFLEENHLIVISSFLTSILLSFPLTALLNKIFLNYYGLNNLFVIPYMSFYDIPLLFPIGLLLIFLLISTLFIAIPISIYKSKSISNELRDE